MGSCTGYAKLFLTILGLCFTLAGGCLMYVGIIVFSGYQLEYNYIWVPGATILFVSVSMIILGLVACCAACREDKTGLLSCFFTISTILVILELTGGTVAIVYKEKVKDGILNDMRKSLFEYGFDGDVTSGIDSMQETLKCCGVETFTDWIITPWGLLHPGQVPISCCKKDIIFCLGSAVEILLGSTYKEGCYNVVEKKVETHLNKIIGVSSGLLSIQVIGLIFSCVFKP